MNWPHRFVGLGAFLLACLLSVPAIAVDEDVETFARVVVGETQLRSGPGVAHRVVHVAERGETFAVQGREATGFWFRVYLSDGRTAYVLGDVVETVAVGEDAENAPSAPGFFAAPNLASASGGVAMMGGLTGGIGYAEIRPALVLAPAIAIVFAFTVASLALWLTGTNPFEAYSLMWNFGTSSTSIADSLTALASSSTPRHRPALLDVSSST